MSVPKLPDKPTPSNQIVRGAVFYYDFSGNRGAALQYVHPCVVVSRTRPTASTAILVPLSDVKGYTSDGTVGGKMKYPHNPRITPVQCSGGLGLTKISAGKCDQPQVVDVVELYDEWYIGELNDMAMRQIDLGLLYGLDLWGTIRGTFGTAVDDFVRIWLRMFQRR